ncbi:MAG TPA: tetratricopeptide repeat protein [Smithellaceae bacterium]|nr:tetratricopeptide repeat protein [Smithellaceae bacterium]
MKKLLLLVVFILSFIFWNNSAFCQTKNPLLDDGIKQYQEENYEEAIEVLEKLQTKGPQSSLAAYFLGMAYKQTQDYVKAAANLEVALTLPPAVKEALVEQVNILFQLDRLAEAKKWIAVAKKENIAPANISFLEGMILARERKYSAAIDSFERAKTLDKNLVPTADYQIGLCFLNDKKFKAPGSVSRQPLPTIPNPI